MSQSIEVLLGTLSSIAGSRDLALLQSIQADATKFGQYAATVTQHIVDRIKELERVPAATKPYAPSNAVWGHGRLHPIGHYTVEYKVPLGANWLLAVKRDGEDIGEAATTCPDWMVEDNNGVKRTIVHFRKCDGTAPYYAELDSFLVAARGFEAADWGVFYQLMRVKPTGRRLEPCLGGNSGTIEAFKLEVEILEVLATNEA